MMIVGNAILVAMGVTMLWFLIVRESRWRKRLTNWEHGHGTIVRFDDGTEDEKIIPVIRYTYRGEEMEQVCEFNLYNDPIGSDVAILICPETGAIFINNKRSRWTLSVVLTAIFGFVIFMLWAMNQA